MRLPDPLVETLVVLHLSLDRIKGSEGFPAQQSNQVNIGWADGHTRFIETDSHLLEKVTERLHCGGFPLLDESEEAVQVPFGHNRISRSLSVPGNKTSFAPHRHGV